MGDSENGKVQKTSLKALIKGKVPFWEITEIVKYRETCPKGINKGKVPLGRGGKVNGIVYDRFI